MANDEPPGKQVEQRFFYLLAESSSEFIGMCDLDMRPTYVNPAGRRMVGLPDMASARRVEVKDYFFPEDQAFIAETFFPRVLREGGDDMEIRLRNFQTNEPIWMYFYLFSIFDTNGEVVGWATVGHDITERKRAEEEKEKLQTQLLQAQKMDSVGRLAGGVAHDFNNMLAVILGHTEIAMDRIGLSDPLRADLEEIHKAAQRSAGLTRQLLAFARKQVIEPKVHNLNDTIDEMLKMLQRLIGENINLAWLPGRELWSIKMDPSQIDQILANICINSRDAISGVGKITIETGNATFDKLYCSRHADFSPGDYVFLAVSDNGCGMDVEMISHLFEPFFTTKKMGTGLGLSTVYGVVKQNNGFINVYSELGQGTTFRIYLKRYLDEAGHEPKLVPALETVTTRGSETILLVEDESAILEIATLMLKTEGYTVMAANTPNEAIRIAKEHAGKIHLLISDVVMPEMNGRDMAKYILPLYPNMKCLFMSGYTANVIADHGVLDDGVNFIQKPFSKQALLSKVRQLIDEKEEANE